MQIEINGKAQEIVEPCTLEQCLTLIKRAEEKGIAVAINQAIVPRSRWPEHHLKANDKIAIFRAIAGG